MAKISASDILYVDHVSRKSDNKQVFISSKSNILTRKQSLHPKELNTSICGVLYGQISQTISEKRVYGF